MKFMYSGAALISIVLIFCTMIYHNLNSSQTDPLDIIQPEINLTEQLLKVESNHRIVPPESFELLDSVISDGIAAIGENRPHPQTAEEAISISVLVSEVLAKHNFFQPPNSYVPPDTLGQALSPRTLSKTEIENVLNFESNKIRAKSFSPSVPIYFVDCDMGSFMIMRIFDEFGWDTRLVKARNHVFLRWHLPNGTTVNWDWTNWDSFEDELYLSARKTTAQEQVAQGTYLKSLTRKETKGNFLGLIGSNVDNSSTAVSILRDALRLSPNNPTNLNNLAWYYVTDPSMAVEFSEVAIMYSHRSIASDLSRPNGLGTLACAYAANGQWELAASIQKHLIKKAYSNGQKSYAQNLIRMEQKKLCERTLD